MTDPNNDRPLITFALFAYNQEKYIRDAVEGAFAQTYEPLEIILSDDCSVDKTFEIMREMAEAYDGPNDVRVRRNEVNIGTVDHVITVAREAIGELLVVAAGDDISLPMRTREVCAAWNESRASVILSNHDRVDENGVLIEENVKYRPLERFQEIMQNCTVSMRYDGQVRNIPGYCAAYDRKFVAETPFSEERLFNEDSLFSYLINFEGKHIEHVDQALLKVREAITSVSARKLSTASVPEIVEREQKLKEGCYSKMRFYNFLFNVCLDRNYECFVSVYNKLYKDLLKNEFVVNYYNMSNLDRFLSIFTVKSKTNRRFVAIRIFGVYGLWVLTRVRDLCERKKN